MFFIVVLSAAGVLTHPGYLIRSPPDVSLTQYSVFCGHIPQTNRMYVDFHLTGISDQCMENIFLVIA